MHHLECEYSAEGVEGGQREGGGTTTATEGGGKSRGNILSRGGAARKKGQEERSDTETEAAGGETGSSQSHYKKGHMTNVCLTDSVRGATVDFMKDHKQLYNKTNEHFTDTVRKESI